MTPYILWYCPYFSQFREREMISVWSEAEKLSHIWTIEVTNTYLKWLVINVAASVLQRSSILTMNLSKNFQVLPWKGGDDVYEDVLFKPKIKLLAENTHWILKSKVWDSSKQDTFWDGRQGVSGLWGKYCLPITSRLDNDSSNKSFFQSIQVKYYHHTWKI